MPQFVALKKVLRAIAENRRDIAIPTRVRDGGPLYEAGHENIDRGAGPVYAVPQRQIISSCPEVQVSVGPYLTAADENTYFVASDRLASINTSRLSAVFENRGGNLIVPDNVPDILFRRIEMAGMRHMRPGDNFPSTHPLSKSVLPIASSKRLSTRHVLIAEDAGYLSTWCEHSRWVITLSVARLANFVDEAITVEFATITIDPRKGKEPDWRVRFSDRIGPMRRGRAGAWDRDLFPQVENFFKEFGGGATIERTPSGTQWNVVVNRGLSRGAKVRWTKGMSFKMDPADFGASLW